MSLWDKILEIVGSLVSPDWEALVGLIPLALLLPVGGYLAWVVVRHARAGPQIARPLPVPPTPAGIHLPGPSLAPFLAAGGAFALFLSTLFIKIVPAADPASGRPIPDSTMVVVEPLGGVALAVGLAAMIGALLYWGREANRDYHALEATAEPEALDALEATAEPEAFNLLPAVAGSRPPAGVHLPGPSFRPLLASIAAAALLLGLVIDPVVFVAGILMTIIGLLGWLVDARKEYREVEKADATGHLGNIPAPRLPTGTLVVFAVLFVGSLLMAGGIIPPRGETPVPATPPPGVPATPAPGAPTPTPATPGVPTDGEGEAVVLLISAQGIAFDTDTLEVPANTPFQIVFANNDAGIPHNVAIHEGSP
ncbi:MAG TPA: hypothetical protein VLM76_02785, partial [Patescibacteria group bacterium]|nr:hypothetical protein [Patescibacteria group bacterium]